MKTILKSVVAWLAMNSAIGATGLPLTARTGMVLAGTLVIIAVALLGD